MVKNRIKDVYDYRMSTEKLEDFLKEFTMLQNSLKLPFKDSKINKVLGKLSVSLEKQEYRIDILKEYKEETIFEDRSGVSEYSEDFLSFKSFLLATFEEDLATVDSSEFKAKFQKRLGAGDTLDQAFNERQSLSSFYKEKHPADQHLRSKTEEQSSYCLTPNRTINTINAKKIEGSEIGRESSKRVTGGGSLLETKVLPGGKYGLAVYIKYFASEKLRALSLGKILSLINKGLQINLIEHVKVLPF